GFRSGFHRHLESGRGVKLTQDRVVQARVRQVRGFLEPLAVLREQRPVLQTCEIHCFCCHCAPRGCNTLFFRNYWLCLSCFLSGGPRRAHRGGFLFVTDITGGSEISPVMEATTIGQLYDVIYPVCSSPTDRTILQRHLATPSIPAKDTGSDVTPVHQKENGLLAFAAAPRRPASSQQILTFTTVPTICFFPDGEIRPGQLLRTPLFRHFILPNSSIKVSLTLQ